MACKCENPREILAKIREVESNEEAAQFVASKCISYHQRDGEDLFALLGVNDSGDKMKLDGFGWVQIGKSYMWAKDG